MIAKERQVLHLAAELLLSVILWVEEALAVVEAQLAGSEEWKGTPMLACG